MAEASVCFEWVSFGSLEGHDREACLPVFFILFW